ncbi:sodium/proline symporter [Aquimarina sp. 2201CG14-23]|uniref:sodium/proline symporter n=1 Tax=Aquimarina mycalae TaxID=3040073 RepID=UPI002477EEF6|nr:sodium/proline symporter [Aquimarina sp. 2201CG14-23]MDH7447411.1 sodium/proline symporter [Aquimarina sp. 2201CG14-23]
MITKYTILFLYFSILFMIGYFASKRIKTTKDYYVGGKKLGFWVVAFSARATGESAWLLLGLTGLGAMVGVSAFWVVLGEVLGVAVSWFFMAEKFKVLSDKYNSITIPDYLVSRFKSSTHTLRIVAATALSLFVVIYVSAQIDATGSAFESFLGWNYFTGAVVGFLIVLAYIFSGGFVAVAWSDLFQGLIMLLGLVALPIVAYYSISSEISISNELTKLDPSFLNIWGDGGFTMLNFFTILGFACIGLGFMGSPQLFVRFMSIKDVSEIKKGRWVAIVFTILTDSCAVLIGIFGRYLLTSLDANPEEILGNGAQNVLPMLVERIMPLTLIGVYIAAVLSAIMSTIDSLLVVASSAISRDFYQQIFKPNKSEKQLANISRIITFVLAVFALIIAMIVAITTPGRTIFWFVIFGWSGIAATFCPTIILSVFWNKFSEKGAIASMITGFLSVPFFKFGMTSLDTIGVYFDELGELGPSFILAILVGVVVSLATTKQKPENEPHTGNID